MSAHLSLFPVDVWLPRHAAPSWPVRLLQALRGAW